MDSLIIQQGPTEFYMPLLGDNVLLSTWMDEPVLPNKGLSIINKKPDSCGVQNINYQASSSLAGCLWAKEKNIPWCIKIRSDHFMDESTVNLLLQKIPKDKLSFLSYFDHMGGYLLDYIVAGPTELMCKLWSLVLHSGEGGFPEQRITHIVRTEFGGEYYPILPLLKDLKVWNNKVKVDMTPTLFGNSSIHNKESVALCTI